MGYVEDNLLQGERVLIKSKITSALFLYPFVLFVLSLISISITLNAGNIKNETASFLASFYLCLSGFLFFIAILATISAVIRLVTTEFAVTNIRIIAKTGFIKRNSLDLRLSKVESVEVNQNILGRLLSFGTITITGTGGTKQSFKGIVDPIVTKRKINQIIEHYSAQQNNPPQIARSNA
jgi:uncharacterized membrane protein YdbT with pleckstrin-like domain